jgi:hypothetical protein
MEPVPGRTDLAEQLVGGQAGEDVDGEVGDRPLRAEELADREVVDREHGQRADQAPQQPEDAVLVADLDLAPDEQA